MTPVWFSAMVRLVTSVEGLGPGTYMRSVFVFRAADWESARLKAIALGRRAEATYENADRRRVHRDLLCVETLDMLDEEMVDGREVYSEPVEVGGDLDVGASLLAPEDSKPTQSGV